MNVKLAAQTLSSSVADAIEFMDEIGHPSFLGSASTVAFIRKIDRIFDLLNQTRKIIMRKASRRRYLNQISL